MTDTDAPAPRTGAKQWWGLAVLVIPSTLLFMMLTILFLAAPNMAADLGPTSAQLLWILDIYGFVMAGFLVAMGVLGDRVGKRRLMVIGAVVFGIVSIAAAMTTSPELMIAWRAVLGLGGAMMLPSTLGLIFVLFADPRARGIAIGMWAGGISAGVALGPLLSGLLLEAFGWEATFLVAVPVMALVAIGAPWLLPEHKDKTARIDIFSALLLVTALLSIIYGIKRFATQEPVGPTIGLLATGALVGLWFVIRQLRATNPLLECDCSPTAQSAERSRSSSCRPQPWEGCTPCSLSTCSWSRGSRRCRRGCRSSRPRQYSSPSPLSPRCSPGSSVRAT